MQGEDKDRGILNGSTGTPGAGASTGRTGAESKEQELNRKLRHMSSLARHDINNQLTIINGYLSLLESGSSSVTNGDIIRILQGATDRIQRILKFTRDYQDLGANPPAWQELGMVIRTARMEVDIGTVRFTTGDTCSNVSVYADPLLVKVFSSLIENSLRHGKGMSEIRISCHAGDRRLSIMYEDDGAGIADPVRSVLFEPGKGKNTGYGLFLVRDILGITGMTISETGNPAGAGVRFEIVVPEGCFR